MTTVPTIAASPQEARIDHACADCGWRGGPGSCANCGEGPVLDLRDTEVVIALLKDDEARNSRRQATLRGWAAVFGMVAGLLLLFFVYPTFIRPLGHSRHRGREGSVIFCLFLGPALAANALLNATLGAKPRFPYLL